MAPAGFRGEAAFSAEEAFRGHPRNAYDASKRPFILLFWLNAVPTTSDNIKISPKARTGCDYSMSDPSPFNSTHYKPVAKDCLGATLAAAKHPLTQRSFVG